MKIGKTKCPLIAQVRGDKRFSIKEYYLNQPLEFDTLNIRKKSKLFLYFFSLSRIIMLIIEYW